MGHPVFVDEEALMEWAETRQRTKLMEWLNQNGIRYHLNRRGRICSTVDAVNASLLRREAENDVEFQ